MARFDTKYATAEYPVGSFIGGSVLQAAYGHMKAPVGVANADVIGMCKVPFGATILAATVFSDGVKVADAAIGWAGTPNALTLIEGPVKVPNVAPSVDASGGQDVVITYTVATADAIAAGDDVYCVVHYVFEAVAP